ncbi:GtrA family protein [Clostridium sp. MCC334]|nr:GtrA family protein [Clostridium sp. MCC334]
MMEKYKDIVPYAIFGILTTIINIVVYLFFAHILKKEVMLSTLAAWFLSVLFAYVTNRKWVFHSGVLTFSNIIREAVAFFICRLATGIADILIMFIFVNIFHFNDLFIKIISNIAVIILNYVASKWIIFNHK